MAAYDYYVYNKNGQSVLKSGSAAGTLTVSELLAQSRNTYGITALSATAGGEAMSSSATISSWPTVGDRQVAYDATPVETVSSFYLDGTQYVLGGSGGDMSYSDYNWVSKSGATVTLDLASTITPSANFTVNAPSTIKDGQTYILRVTSGATAYTMTLGTNITNPYSADTTLTANGIDQFIFLAVGGNLELQPKIGGGGTDYSWVTKTISSGNVEIGLRTIVDTPASNFTLTKPATLKDGEEYVLRTISGATAYTITLGTGFTNPRNVSLTLSAKATDQFVFLAIGGELELQPLVATGS